MSDSPSPQPQSPSDEEPDDRTLLRQWVERADSGSIRELTRRHAGLVMGTAARALSGNQILAEEAAQAVFTVMTAKAASLRHHPSLPLWLHRAALLEASGLRRREARRQRHLTRLAEELETMHSPETTPDWQRALPELDGALERLSAADRQLLILRYYEGHHFKNLAARLGKSDDTLQKQTSRALEKLSRQLRRRGVAVPALALASGLGGLTPHVPAAVTVKLAATAVTQAPHFGWAAAIFHSVKLMTCTQSTTLTAGAAVLLLLLCGAAGYRSGFATAASASTPSPMESDPQSSVHQKTDSKTNRPPPGGRPDSGSLMGSAGTAKPPLLDILKAAGGIEMGLNGDWSRFSESTYPILGHYDPRDTEEAIALLPELRQNDNPFESASGLIFSVLAEQDWQQARDRLMKGDVLRNDGKISGQAIRVVAEAWGQEDPAAAFRWANTLVDEGRTPFAPDRGVGELLLTSWLKRDPEAALAEMDQRAGNQPRLVGQAVRFSFKQQPEWWLKQLAPDAPPESRSRMLRFGRCALTMIPEANWQEALDSFVKDPALSAELLSQLKP